MRNQDIALESLSSEYYCWHWIHKPFYLNTQTRTVTLGINGSNTFKKIAENSVFWRFLIFPIKVWQLKFFSQNSYI